MKKSIIVALVVAGCLLTVSAAYAIGSGALVPDKAPESGSINFTLSAGGVSIPDARVTLYRIDDNVAGDGVIVNAPGNPKTAPDGMDGKNNVYTFDGLAYGDYRIIAECRGYSTRCEIISISEAWPSADVTSSMAGILYDSLTRANESGDAVYGYVMDQNFVPIPDATVTLWSAALGSDTGPIVNEGLANVSDNPARTASGDNAGYYVFEGVKPGWYNATAEKDGHMWYAIFNLTGAEAGGHKAIISIPDYAYIPG